MRRVRCGSVTARGARALFFLKLVQSDETDEVKRRREECDGYEWWTTVLAKGHAARERSARLCATQHRRLVEGLAQLAPPRDASSAAVAVAGGGGQRAERCWDLVIGLDHGGQGRPPRVLSLLTRMFVQVSLDPPMSDCGANHHRVGSGAS